MRVLSSRVGRSATPIRPFRMARDLAGLADLVEVCFEADLERTGSQIVAEMRAMASWGVTLQMLTLFGPPYRGLVWEEEGRLVGNLTTMRERTGAWSLSNIAVLPEARGRGIGGALIDAAIERLRGMGVHSITLQVRQDNELAIGMYERRGFVTYDRVQEVALDAVAWPTLGRGVQGVLRSAATWPASLRCWRRAGQSPHACSNRFGRVNGSRARGALRCVPSVWASGARSASPW
jgi:ribosomal protein S18 acetylase RimI-like enzyme